jgi:hypothetical protein
MRLLTTGRLMYDDKFLAVGLDWIGSSGQLRLDLPRLGGSRAGFTELEPLHYGGSYSYNLEGHSFHRMHGR